MFCEIKAAWSLSVSFSRERMDQPLERQHEPIQAILSCRCRSWLSPIHREMLRDETSRDADVEGI